MSSDSLDELDRPNTGGGKTRNGGHNNNNNNNNNDDSLVGASDLSMPQDLTAAMQAALVNFDGMRVSAVIVAGFDVRHTYVDAAKYRNALHELTLNYASYSTAERPAKLTHQFIDVLTVLLQNGLDINDVDNRHQTALHLLCSSPGAHPEIVRILLASGARVNQPDSGQQTALHRAVVSASPADVATLLEGGADPNFVDNMGHSALHVATKKKNNGEILKLLVERGAKVNLNHPEWARHSKGATPLHTAARLGQLQNAEALLRLGADPNVIDAAGQTPLHVAAAHEITGRLCALLLRRGARPDVRDRLLCETALHKAVRGNMVDNVRALLQPSPGSKAASDARVVDSFGNTALHRAAALPSTDPTVWTLLLAARAPPGAVNVDGLTAVEVAQRVSNSVGLAMMRCVDY